jgi:hypothetical protein
MIIMLMLDATIEGPATNDHFKTIHVNSEKMHTILRVKKFGRRPVVLYVGGSQRVSTSGEEVKNIIPNSGVHLYKAGIWGYLFGCALIESVLSARNPFFIRTALTTSKVGSHCETPGEVTN